MGMGVGHFESRGGYRAVLELFIRGCRAAAAEGVPLRFGGGHTAREQLDRDDYESIEYSELLALIAEYDSMTEPSAHDSLIRNALRELRVHR